MLSPFFRARQTEIQAFLKLWASAETSETYSKRSNSCLSGKSVPYGNRCSRKGLGRRRKFKPDEGTGSRIFCPEKRNLTQILLLQSRLPRLKRTRSYYFQVCKCFLLFEDRLLQFPVRQDTGYITIKNNLAYLRNSLKSNRLDTCACGLDIFIPQLF